MKMLTHLFTNWKTTLAGAAALAAVGAKIANGHFDVSTDLPAIFAGVGLMTAKDHNVTGGTHAQDGGTVPAGPVPQHKP
jgi:hypothetical protein